MRITSTVLVVVLGVAASVAVHGQALTERNVSLQLARTIADAAIAACLKDGFNVTVAVVDRAGDLKLLLRADNANPHNADLARRKAYTSRTYGFSSMEFRNRTAGGSELAGQRQLAEVIALGGGVPILIGNERIGGLGLSGSPTQEDDEKCAMAAMAAVAGSLR